MNAQDQFMTTDRLRRAVLAFQHAQGLVLVAHRQLKDKSHAHVDAYWEGPGRRINATIQASARELVDAFRAFSAAGLVASAADRHQVTEAERCLAEGAF
ncbi:MAG TPA: hypothetical protein VIL69_05430 [Roseomonas sp.]|jgi:hypothetical protein